MMTTVFTARTIHTMDPSCPTATAIAVRDGRILHVGTEADVVGYLSGGDFSVDRRYEDCVIVPGFVEAHGHLVFNGSIGEYVWLGYDDRMRPDGTVAPGCRSVDDVVDRLAAAASIREGEGSSVSVIGYGYDPTFQDNYSLNRHDLDRASSTVKILVINASGHLAYANSALMEARGITGVTDDRGVLKDADGHPLGEFHETAMGLLFAPEDFATADPSVPVWNGGWLAQLAGCTTMTDLSMVTLGGAFDTLLATANRADYPVRVVYAPSMATLTGMMEGEALAGHLCGLRDSNTDRVAMGPLKWIADGSIQGYTGKLRWPGYCGGMDHGFLILDEEQIVDQLQPLHELGFQAAIHTNGDEATEVTLRALERVLTEAPRPDHRHRLEHCQLASRDQFRRMAQMGVGVNLFSNHLFYWGDIHRSSTVGPDKARRMNAAATAQREGVHFSLHSDAPVTPVGPLFTMWCAVNRVTRTGVVLGEHEKIAPEAALEAMTLGAAWLLKMDDVIGSIEVGKFADLTVLDADPLSVDPMVIKDIGVVGTVLGGQPVVRTVQS